MANQNGISTSLPLVANSQSRIIRHNMRFTDCTEPFFPYKLSFFLLSCALLHVTGPPLSGQEGRSPFGRKEKVLFNQNLMSRGRSIDPENEKLFPNDSHLPIFENSGTKCPGKWWTQRPSRFGPSVPRNETQIAEMGLMNGGLDRLNFGKVFLILLKLVVELCTTVGQGSRRAPPFPLISPNLCPSCRQ